MHNSSGVFILFRILRGCRGQHLQNKENVSMSKQMTVNGWHEVCGDRLAISNSHGMLWGCEELKTTSVENFNCWLLGKTVTCPRLQLCGLSPKKPHND
jgi:hypothetical protein